MACALLWTVGTQAQTEVGDSVITLTDDEMAIISDTALVGTLMGDTIQMVKTPRDWTKWRPSSKRAMWLAAVIPGAGQIYNRKFWKLPIIYGGFVGCIYAWRWNNMMYHDYAQAYLDLKDNDPSTQSYTKFQRLGTRITPAYQSRYEELFKNRKDRYRRWRDLSFFVMCGVYAISIIDAYVDASLSEFDISGDLTMRVTPAIINSQGNKLDMNPIKSSAIGLQCSLFF